MQIAGRPCERCAETIAIAKHGRGCVPCDVVFHRSCAVDPKKCPRCGADVVEARRAASRTAEAADRRELDRGRGILWAATIVPVIFEIGTLSLALVGGPAADQLATQAVRVMLLSAILVAMHRGSTSAAGLLIFMLGIAGIFGTALAVIGSGSTLGTAIVVGHCGVYVALAVMMAMTPAFWAVLRQRRDL